MEHLGILDFIWFTDEAWFHVCAYVSTKIICGCWISHKQFVRSHCIVKIMCDCAISWTWIIGTLFVWLHFELRSLLHNIELVDWWYYYWLFPSVWWMRCKHEGNLKHFCVPGYLKRPLDNKMPRFNPIGYFFWPTER